MDFKEYQESALRTAGTQTEEQRLLNCCLGLSGESGEFNDMIKKTMFHGHTLDKNKIAKELGDILWYLSVAADSLGFSLEEIATMNIDKLKARYPEGFSTERSINRKE